MTVTWPPARLRLAALVLLTALLTGAGMSGAGAPGGDRMAAAYVAIAAFALVSPGFIVIQVLAGQWLAGMLLLAGVVPPLRVLPWITGVAVTAELLASVRRLDGLPGRRAAGDVGSAAISALVVITVFPLVLLAGRLPGPTGGWTIVLAVAGCLVVAFLLLAGTDPSFGSRIPGEDTDSPGRRLVALRRRPRGR